MGLKCGLYEYIRGYGLDSINSKQGSVADCMHCLRRETSGGLCSTDSELTQNMDHWWDLIGSEQGSVSGFN